MTATSPYAPPRRNSHLRPPLLERRSSSSSVGSAAASVGFLLWVLRYWEDAAVLHRIRQALRRTLPEHWKESFAPVFLWIQGAVTNRMPRLRSAVNAVVPATVNNNAATGSTTGATTAEDRIRENHRRIQEVLKYWFGQNTPDGSQKKLWMIADSSGALRAKVDAEITDRFASLLIELASSSSSDGNNKTWQEWCQDDRDLYNYQGKLAAIIVLDQFSRHIHRFHTNTCTHSDNENDDSRSLLFAKQQQQLPEQSVLDTLALRTAELLQEHHHDEITSGMIPLPMYIFALMPYRHASRMETVQFVQTQVEASEGLLRQYDGMLRRFRKATNRRMAVLQDTARSTGDATKSEYTDDDILECFPFDGDMSMVHKHAVHECIVKFLAERGVHPDDNSKDAPPRPIIISLSGGVDSMVIASVLSHLRQFGSYNLQLVAVHIDYSNRPEAAAEASYVARYCEQLGIEYRGRCIDEVTRGITARDDYERIAREIRYRTYREAVQDCLSDREHPESIEVGVMLGHHRGDLRENVLSNAHKGCGPLDLSGMTAVSRNDGITLYRPLLPLEKCFVYDYAHTFGVPYFKDTTPHWSTRGKLRNRLVPLLEEIYGEGSMNNLSNLAVESDECRSLLHEVALKPFLDQVVYKPMGFYFATTPWKAQSLVFWKFVLREALHSAGIGMLTDKSVVAFLERVQSEIVKEGWLQCRKDCAFFLRLDGTVFVLYPECFPWRKADFYALPETGLKAGKDEAVQVGPWEVRAQIVKEDVDGDEKARLLESRAVPSIEHLMSGAIFYYLEVSSAQQPLVFKKFIKTNRPRAWKGVDTKIQDTLPMVGKDENAVLNENEASVSLVEVTMTLTSTNHRRPVAQET